MKNKLRRRELASGLLGLVVGIATTVGVSIAAIQLTELASLLFVAGGIITILLFSLAGGLIAAGVRRFPHTPRVFLSYSVNRQGADEFARRIRKAIDDAGARVWDPQINLRLGQVWERQISRAIHDADWFVVLWPENATRNMESEIAEAIAMGKRVISIVLRPSELPVDLQKLIYIDASNDSDKALEAIARLIRG